MTFLLTSGYPIASDVVTTHEVFCYVCRVKKVCQSTIDFDDNKKVQMQGNVLRQVSKETNQFLSSYKKNLLGKCLATLVSYTTNLYIVAILFNTRLLLSFTQVTKGKRIRLRINPFKFFGARDRKVTTPKIAHGLLNVKSKVLII